ncbi:hypothetical protein B0H19DRAFT_1093907 [Mycena capillaripes]|nr:hypothetical protein B0H19DRAFT_1093907 [Mycena capillaripes]
MRRFAALFFALVLPFSAAQIVTTTDDAGETIVENITIDPVLQVPTTIIISTIIPTTVTTTVTTVDPAGETVVEVIIGDGLGDSTTQTIQTIPPANPNPGGQGPVGQPGPTGAAGLPTPFTYTTTDANGDTIPVVATFTPSFATTVMPSATFQATVLDYSVYTASYATQVQTAQNFNQNGAVRRSSGWWGPCLSLVISVVGGIVLIRGA